MKLILKDSSEIDITYANNIYAFESFVDGQGYPINKKDIISLVIKEDETNITFDEIKEKITLDNIKDFKLSFNDEEEKSYPGYKISSVQEEITDERQIITITIVKE